LNGPITLGNYTFGWGANTPFSNSTGIAIGGDISVNAGTTVNFQGAEGWSGFNGRLTFNTNRVIDVGANANMNVQWGIAGTGGFTKNGTGTLTLSGVNTYTGATTINVGTLATSGDNRIATSNSVTVNSGGTFALGGNQTLASITGSGTIQLGNYTLTTGASNSTYSGTISGNGGLTKSGAGRFELTGDTSIGGNLVATAGTLVINGANATSAASMTIQSNATLMGSGIISGNATISGTHSPGNSPGVQTFQNNLTYTAGSSVVWELISNTTSGRGTNYDGIDVGGNLVFDGSSNVILDFDLAGSSVDWSDSFWDISKIGKSGWKLFGVTGTITGFENLQIAAGSYPDGASQSLTASRPNASFYLYEGDDGIYLNYAPIPEPSTAVLAALSAIGLLRRKRS
jgi:autotransporter-associated beta strand protein